MKVQRLWKGSWPGIALLALAASVGAAAEPSAERGRAIAQEAYDRDSGWGDYQAEITMILRNQAGDVTERSLRSRFLEIEGDGDKSLIIFDTPPDVRGTALLTFTYKTGNDDQWLYLPAVKRVRRIASNNKSGPFMGSEFAYEDMVSQELEKYTYDFLREEDLNGEPCFVIERIPADTNSGYTRQIVWLDQSHYRMHKVEYYDRRDELLKTLTGHDYEQFLGRIWRAGRLEMVNHQTGKSTSMIWSNFSFGNGFTDRDFDQNSLQRVR